MASLRPSHTLLRLDVQSFGLAQSSRQIAGLQSRREQTRKWSGVAGLFISAALAARRAGTGEPLNGAMMALLYFATVALVYLVGQALELLPDPLPGLPADDSTYFFVWPLAQIIAGTLGSLVGGVGSGFRAD